MSILKFLLDDSILNAHVLLNCFPTGSDVIFVREFKRRIAEALVRRLIDLQDRRTTLRNVKTRGEAILTPKLVMLICYYKTKTTKNLNATLKDNQRDW